MHLFYTPDIASDHYTLNEEETRHVSVLRLSPGNQINLVDGKGGFYEAEILSVGKKATELQIISSVKEYGKRNYRLHIAVAPTKNIDRFEWLLEKATEIGIDEITPILCTRSERKQIKSDRLNKVITSAVKQSLRAYHPLLNELTEFADLIGATKESDRYIAHCMDEHRQTLKESLKKDTDCIILIGPEGDFTAEELHAAQAVGFSGISLGNSRLRTETAALEACFEVNFLNR